MFKWEWLNRRSMYFKVFCLALLTAVLLFLPAMIVDGGYFLLVGDFNSQQVPFYRVAHQAIRSGEWGWNWYTDLGANFISSYSFYLLGSPFFWLTIPFPADFVPYLMGPLLMLKFACAATTAYAYLKNYVNNPWYAVLGGMLYAFCGFSIYNIFFNHFHDVMVFFPLLLLAMDELMEHDTRGALAAAVAINALVNYFFFFGEVVFLILYYVLRVGMRSYTRSWKKFFTVAGEAVLGLCISGVLMVPSLLTLLQNERVYNPLSGINMWVFSKERLMTILTSYFLPPEFTSKQIYFENAGTRWTSLSAYIPIFGVTGVFAYVRSRRKDWLRSFVLMLVVMSVVPIFNSLFVALNATYYARWFYMLVLMMILATIRVMDEGGEEMQESSRIVLVITLALIALIGLTPSFKDGKLERLGLFNKEYWPFFLLLALVALVAWCVQYMLISERKDNPRSFLRRSLAAVCIFAVLFGNFYIFWGKAYAYSSWDYLIPDAIRGEEKITIPDKDEAIRIDTDNSLSNAGMFWNVPCMHAFHSIVPASIVQFYEYIGESRSVSSKIPEKQYALRSFLSVHWYFDRIGSSDTFGDPVDSSVKQLMPGYSYYDTMAGYEVWENEYYIPMGFVYDAYITEEEMADIPASRRIQAMLKGVLLTEEQIRSWGDLLEPAGVSYGALTEEEYYRDCRARAQKTVQDMTITADGFTARSDFEEEEIVFFSVPWEEGWSARVNGESVPVEKVNVGFMAIRVPAGEAEIEFVYRTPGLRLGLALTGGGLAVLGLYLACSSVLKKRRKKRAVPEAAPAGDEEFWSDSPAEQEENNDTADEGAFPEV